MYHLILVFIIAVSSALAKADKKDSDQPKVLIAKCEFNGDASNEIEVGRPFLYIFGKRIVKGTDVRIENFEVEHDIAVVPDDITSDSLPNLDIKKIYQADFPPVDPKNFGDRIRSVYWKHEPIDGRTESTILQVITYQDIDQFHTQSRGTYSALAYHFGFTGQYPYCWVRGMSK